METVTLNATTRTQHGKGPARRLRAEGGIPTVTYGQGAPTESLTVDAKELRSILLSERGRNSIIELAVDDQRGDPYRPELGFVGRLELGPASRLGGSQS